MELFCYVLATFSALCIALPVHEWAHAYVAYKQGDHTAKVMGRMTIAPFAHFDAWGFVCLFFLGFGWAKPVPIDPRNFKNDKKSNFLVSIAGVTANFVTGVAFIIISCALNKFVPNYMVDWGWYGYCLQIFLNTIINLSFALVFFNILPIYPLDGFRVVETYTSPNNGYVNFMRKYSKLILIAVILFSSLFEIYFHYTSDNVIKFFTWVFDNFFGLFG